MRIVITGGAGFLGSRLARKLLERGKLTDARGATREIRSLVLLDIAPPSAPLDDARVTTIAGDLADPAVIERAIAADTDSVFHLAAVVSAQAEAEFDVGMRVNLDATRTLLERCRRLSAPPKFVFASSLAVFGGPLPDPVPDDAPFASGMIREPLAGVEAICPVSPTTRMWVQSPRAVIENLIIGHETPAAAFAHTRSINVPGICVGVRDMVAALRKVAGDAVADRVKWQLDPAIDKIVQTWAANFAPKLGPALGMRADPDFETIIRAHIADELPQSR